MFPRHVRWYRLLLFILTIVLVNSDEAIAKTEGNLNLDSGLGILITCPATSTILVPCGTEIPEVHPSFTNSISDGDADAFMALGGSFTGSPDGQVVVLAIELATGNVDGCNFAERQFIIYDDANFNNILEITEFAGTCVLNYIIDDSDPMDPIDIDCSDIEDLVIDCSTIIPADQTLTDYIDGELTTTGDGILTGSSSSTDKILTIENNFLFTGSGTTSDIIFTGFTGSGSNPDAIFITGSGTSQDIIFTVSDINGNTATCSQLVTLNLDVDDIDMELDITCNAPEVMLVDGSAVVTALSLVDEINDACFATGPYSYAIACAAAGPCNNPDDLLFTETKTFCCDQLGSSVNVIVRVTDANGNEATCNTTVAVESENGNQPLAINCTNESVQLDENGNASIEAQELVEEIVEACDSQGPYTFELAYLSAGLCNNVNDLIFEDMKSFCCEQIDTEVGLIVRVTDKNGVMATCETTVSVEAGNNTNTDPELICTSEFVSLDANGVGSIQATELVEDFIEGCGSVGPYTYEVACVTTGPCNNPNDLTFSASKSFCCAQVGTMVQLIVRATDANGEMTTCLTNVTVQSANGDNETELVITCSNDNIVLDSDGNATVQAADLVDNITDACGASGPYTYELAFVEVTSCYNINDLLFEPTKDLCCEQAGTDVEVIVRVTDADGNMATCVSTLTVEPQDDNFAIVCAGSQQAILEDNGLAVVAPQNFILEILDNCGSSGPYTYEIAKVNAGPCGIPNDIVFESGKAFCCAEIGTVPVIVRVTDVNGSAATCMTNVEVVDIIDPVITSCPANQTVHCSTPIDLNDLTPFGVATGTDNCNLDIIESHEDLRDECGLGDIIRTFTFKDDSDNTVSCEQILTVYNNDLFDESDITWPDNKTYADMCNLVIPTPADSGSPTFSSTACSSVLVTHTDSVIEFAEGCYVVNRKWVVIDWCQFDSDAPSSTYRWENIQVLTFENNVAPTFDTCQSVVESCGNEISCSGIINLEVNATDDCADAADLLYVYSLTLEDGTVVNGTGNSINEPYPFGTHSIVWAVTDGCGNQATCVQSVTIKDCKPPTAVCLSGVNINLSQNPGEDPSAVIWAVDLDASSSDNCTPTEELEFSFNTDFTEPSMYFDCTDIGSHNVVLYVRDGDGNIGICKSDIGVQDNFDLCDNTLQEEGEVLISGRVSAHNNVTMEDVDVMLDHGNDPIYLTTDNEGNYAFEHLPKYDNFKLVPSFEDEPLNGLSTADIVLIQRHILGYQELDSPYKIIAGDVNNSGSLSAVDIIELRKLILGKQKEFSNSTVWRFVESGQKFVDPASPFPYHQTMNLTALNQDANDMNFVGVKTGDVDYNAFINGFIPEILSFRSSQTLSLVSSSLERGSVQLTVNEEQELTGFQLAFKSSGSLDQLNLTSDLIQIDENNFAIEGDIVKISWSSAEAITVNEGEILFSINFDGDVDFQLVNDLPMFTTEAYNASVNTMNIEINTKTNLVNNNWQVFRNSPNPFVDYTYIPFTAPTKSMLSLSVFDVNGKLIMSKTREVEQGYQKWELSASDLGNVHGVLYYRLESEDFSSTQPFIRLK